ncbi:MAG: hypothetical protein BV456_00975 [Thermoplasmata archaeon M8B2D]|nr:MAG: hypothetical protein BV456_00975 [Thermoplasmata archaeon M8B2D]
MQTVSNPKITVNKLPAVLPAGLDEQKILVIGQKLTAGNAIAGQLYKNISKGDIIEKFGAGSMLQGQLDPIFKIFSDNGSNKLPRVDVIPLDDNAGGVQATSDFVIDTTGGATATKSGIAILYVAGRKYELPVVLGETIADIGAKFEALLTDANAPFSVSELTNTITMTARNKGSVGNSFPVKIEGLEYDGSNWVIGNVSFVINAFTGGLTDPTLTSVLDVVNEIRYQTCLAPIEYGTDFLVKDFLDNRWNVINKILDGVAIYADTDTKANLITLGEGIDSQNVYICGNQLQSGALFKGDLTKLPAYQVQSQIGALRAMRLTESANILNFTPASTYGVLDGAGGKHIGSLPYFNTILKDIDVFPEDLGFDSTEIEELENAGISVLGNNDEGTNVLMGTAYTPYETDGVNPDETFKFLNIVDTLSLSAEYFYKNLKKRFVQSRLTAGVPNAGYSTVNIAIIKAYMLELYKQLSSVELVPAGQEAESYFFENLDLVADYVNGKITATGDLPIVVQLRELLVNLRTKFGI